MLIQYLAAFGMSNWTAFGKSSSESNVQHFIPGSLPCFSGDFTDCSTITYPIFLDNPHHVAEFIPPSSGRHMSLVGTTPLVEGLF